MRFQVQPSTSPDIIAAACQLDHAERSIQLYRRDLRSRTWHGPCELDFAAARPHRLTEALANASGPSWFGPVTCSVPGEPPCRFFVVIHDQIGRAHRLNSSHLGISYAVFCLK